MCLCLQELQCSYAEISSEEPEAVLRKVLLSQQSDRYKKAQAFISVQGLQPDAVARLVSAAVLEGLLASSQEGEPGEESASSSEGLCQSFRCVIAVMSAFRTAADVRPGRRERGVPAAGQTVWRSQPGGRPTAGQHPDGPAVRAQLQ